MTWRTARSLDDLLHEVNAVAPNRAKGRDGTIGDTKHQARASRHNPNKANVVTARDITNDPAGGMPIHVYCRALTAHPDLIPVDLGYMISDRQVASRDRDWLWREYVVPKGGDTHEEHAHFGVGRGPDSAPVGPYDDPSNWHVADLLAGTAGPTHQEPFMALTDDQQASLAKDVADLRYALDHSILPTLSFLVAQAGAVASADAKALADELAKRLTD